MDQGQDADRAQPARTEGRGFGALLRDYRLAAGLTQNALAEQAGLSVRGIADLERGARNFPHAATIERLSDALGLRAAERAVLEAASRRPLSSGELERAANRIGADIPNRHGLGWGPQHNLPLPLNSFVGREAELADIKRLLDSTRLLTLSGPGGVGKTRLALQVAADLSERYSDGIWLVDLAPIDGPELVVQAVARALGAREEVGQLMLSKLSSFLAARRLLVVLDNCEHVITACAELVDTLLRGCPWLQFLATSREALNIAGEVTFHVPPLGLADPDHLPPLESFTQYESVRLLVDRAVAVQPAFTITNQNAATVAQICRHLDGIPLAIELAAARVKLLTPDQIAQRLQDRFRLLTAGSRTALPRHQTLRALIDWSHSLLSAKEAELFRRISVFAGGWTLEAAEAVCAGGSVAALDVLDALGGLVDKSLVVPEQHGDHIRYRLLETIREYASERLQSAREFDDVRARHAAYFRSLVEADAVTRRGIHYAMNRRRGVELVSEEQDNMRAALGTLLSVGDIDQGFVLCQGLSGFWISRGYLNEAQDWLRRFLERAETSSGEVLASSLHTAGRIAEYRGSLDDAQAYFEQSLAVAKQHASALSAARALFGLGDVSMHQGNYERAYQRFQEGLALGRAPETASEQAEALGAIGRIERTRGQATQAKQHFEEALAMQRRLGDAWGMAYTLTELGQDARDDGQLDRAQALEEEALALWRQSGSRMGQRAALMNLTVITYERGLVPRAAELVREVLALCTEISDASPTTVRCVEIAAEILQTLGSSDLAVRLEAAADAQRGALGAPVPPNERAEREKTLAAARSTIPDQLFRQALQMGAQLTLEQAIELAAEALSSVPD